MLAPQGAARNLQCCKQRLTCCAAAAGAAPSRQRRRQQCSPLRCCRPCRMPSGCRQVSGQCCPWHCIHRSISIICHAARPSAFLQGVHEYEKSTWILPRPRCVSVAACMQHAPAAVRDAKGMGLRPGVCGVADASHEVDAALHKLRCEQLPALCNRRVMRTHTLQLSSDEL